MSRSPVDIVALVCMNLAQGGRYADARVLAEALVAKAPDDARAHALLAFSRWRGAAADLREVDARACERLGLESLADAIRRLAQATGGRTEPSGGGSTRPR